MRTGTRRTVPRGTEAGGRHMTATGQLPRFLTRGGAVVEVVEHSREDGNVRIAAYAWRCHGCDLTGADHPWYSPTQACEPTTRTMAALHGNQHATDCRSIPQHGDLAGTLTLALCGLLAKLEETQPHLAPHPGD